VKLEHIAGNTYYINGPTIVGVYIFADRSCLLVDSGPTVEQATRILELLEHNELKVYGIINTHAHADHCAGNKLIQDSSGCKIYASRLERVMLENPLMTLIGIYSASPLQALKNRYLLVKPSVVTDIVEPGLVYIKNTAFTILELSGHSMGQIGVVTPDNISFVGDSLISPDILKKHHFLYLADLDKHLKALDYLEHTEFGPIFLAHEGRVKDLAHVINYNRTVLESLMSFVLETIAVPKTREQVIQSVIKKFKLPYTRTQYFLTLSSISAFLSYLCNTRKAGCNVDDGVMYFYASTKRKRHSG
jgi:glyoxylase-like metal-dependent hydrolase (beta-lactamase superfamily II)